MAGRFVCDDGLVAQSCSVCETIFRYAPPPRAGRPKRLCSENCRLIRKRRRASTIGCDACGKKFSPLHAANGINGNFCSLSCWASTKRIHPTTQSAKCAENRRRRARLRGADVECFADCEIYERDNWRCGICGTKVDKRLAFPHKMSASLDHIVPLAAGGSHTRRNVQCSHWLCNSQKTSGPGGQMRLFG
jgi:hypothetical protein